MATDPVCKMEVEPTQASAKVEYVGQTYYFCSESCLKEFTAEPKKYAVSVPAGRHTHSGSYRHGGK